MSDEHQAKALGSVNHPFVKTPNLDKFSKESFEFTYLSHCNLCTVLQNDKKFKFSLHENQNL